MSRGIKAVGGAWSPALHRRAILSKLGFPQRMEIRLGVSRCRHAPDFRRYISQPHARRRDREGRGRSTRVATDDHEATAARHALPRVLHLRQTHADPRPVSVLLPADEDDRAWDSTQEVRIRKRLRFSRIATERCRQALHLWSTGGVQTCTT